jgi:hypothetical protein
VEVSQSKSSNGDDLSGNTGGWAINKDSFVINDINDGSKLSRIAAIVNLNNSADLNELSENLRKIKISFRDEIPFFAFIFQI